MPTSDPGSRVGGVGRGTGSHGFTLIELLVVIAIIALTTTMLALSMRDGRLQRLEREADRLAMLLETARAESRASGLPVWWRPVDGPAEVEPPGFRFVGLPVALKLPTRWLDDEVHAEVDGGPALPLGPEALIGAQRVWLSIGDQRVAVATDGLAPFEVQAVETP
jgi:general secretion pathway protein H